jgi:hypothetical protein
MKKFFAIGIVSLFLLHLAGVYTYFGVRMMAIHKEMKAKLKMLPADKLEKIILSKEEFKRINFDEEEVELKGKMYDIAKIVEQENHFIIYALHDESEDDLLSFLDEITKKSSDDKEPVPSQLLQFLGLVFIPTSNSFHFPQVTSEKHFSFYSNRYSAFHTSIESPPPRG